MVAQRERKSGAAVVGVAWNMWTSRSTEHAPIPTRQSLLTWSKLLY